MDRLRVSEFLGMLSVATDLAMGQPADFMRTSCVLALRIAEVAGFDDGALRDVYDYAHLRYIGCNADTDLLASLLGDEFEVRRAFAPIDTAKQADVVRVVVHAARRTAAGEGPLGVTRAIARALLGAKAIEASFLGHCEVGQVLATRLGFGPDVIRALGQLYGRWDGKGVPDVRGGDVSPVAMCVALAQDVLVHLRLGGDADAALTVVRGRSGRAYRPDLVEALKPSMLAGLAVAPTWAKVIELEPGSPRWIEGAALDEAFAAIGDFIDIKSPWRLGHSCAVAMLAGAAAERGGLCAGDVADVRFAGFVHDLGTIGVSADTWGQPTPLTEAQLDQVHLHAYHSERIVGRVAHLAGIAAIVGGHHERADGSGYHRATLHPSPSTQLLAAADAYVAMTSDRPYRPRRSPDEAAAILRNEALVGRLDSDVIGCVVDAASGTTTANRVLTTGLTPREIEVLRLLARGNATKQIARQLAISPKTADKHIQQIYAKTGRHTRAGATLFAAEHALLGGP